MEWVNKGGRGPMEGAGVREEAGNRAEHVLPDVWGPTSTGPQTSQDGNRLAPE